MVKASVLDRGREEVVRLEHGGVDAQFAPYPQALGAEERDPEELVAAVVDALRRGPNNLVVRARDRFCEPVEAGQSEMAVRLALPSAHHAVEVPIHGKLAAILPAEVEGTVVPRWRAEAGQLSQWSRQGNHYVHLMIGIAENLASLRHRPLETVEPEGLAEPRVG